MAADGLRTTPQGTLINSRKSVLAQDGPDVSDVLPRRCPKCRARAWFFVSNNIAVGNHCDACGHEEIIRWK